MALSPVATPDRRHIYIAKDAMRWHQGTKTKGKKKMHQSQGTGRRGRTRAEEEEKLENNGMGMQHIPCRLLRFKPIVGSNGEMRW
jgi:hypothetical protein